MAFFFVILAVGSQKLVVEQQITMSESSIRREIVSRYVALSTVFSKNKPIILEDLLAPRYSLFRPGGIELSRPRAIAWYSDLLRNSTHVAWNHRLLQFSHKRNRAYIEDRGMFAARMKLNSNIRDVQVTWESNDTWLRSKGEWRLESCKITEQQVKVDGRPRANLPFP